MKRHQGLLLLGNDPNFVNKLRWVVLNQGYRLKVVSTIEDARFHYQTYHADLVLVCEDFCATGTDLHWAVKLLSINAESFVEKVFVDKVLELIGPSHVEVKEEEITNA